MSYYQNGFYCGNSYYFNKGIDIPIIKKVEELGIKEKNTIREEDIKKWIINAAIENQKNKIQMAAMYYVLKEQIDVTKAHNLAKAWLLLDFCATYGYKKQWEKYGVNNAKLFYISVLNILKELGLNWVNIKSFGALRNKVKGYIDSHKNTNTPYKAVIHKGRGNKNALLNRGTIKDIAIYLRGLGSNYSDSDIYRRICIYCELNDLKKPSISYVRKVLKSKNTRLITELGRFGEGSKWAKLTKSDERVVMATRPNECWQMDATRVNLIGHKDKEGQERFLMVCVVYDVYSKAILGQSYAYSESAQMYRDALSEAVCTHKVLPKHLVMDRFPGHNSQNWTQVKEGLEKYGVKIIKSSAATGKAQVERFFSKLQSVFMSASPFYYGEGITSRRAYAHRSPDTIKAIKKHAKAIGFNKEDAIKETDNILAQYNTTAFSKYSEKIKIEESPITIYNNYKHDTGIHIHEMDRIWIFSHKTHRKIKGQGLIDITISDKILQFRASYEVNKMHDRVILAIPPRYEDTAYLFSEQGAYLEALKEEAPLHVLTDREGLMKARKRKRAFFKAIKAEYEEIKARAICAYGEEYSLLPGKTPKDMANEIETQMTDRLILQKEADTNAGADYSEDAKELLTKAAEMLANIEEAYPNIREDFEADGDEALDFEAIYKRNMQGEW